MMEHQLDSSSTHPPEERVGDVGGASEEEEEGEGDGGRPQERAAQLQLVESQSQMLDEVNSLVDLMTAEKASLQQQLSSVESHNQQLREDNDALRQQQEVQTKGNSCLQEALDGARHELSAVQLQLKTLTHNLEEQKANYAQLTGRCKEVQDEHKKTVLALQSQCAENVKLMPQLSSLQDQAKLLHADNSLLRSKVLSLQQKHKHSQDEILALRGRLTSSHKSQEKLQVKCSALEKTVSSPMAARVPTRSRQEMKLEAECKRKDELLATYVEAATSAQDERQRLQQKIRQLEQMVSDEQEDSQAKSKKLEEIMDERERERKTFEARIQEINDRRVAKVEQEEEFSCVRRQLEQRLQRIEMELVEARNEVSTLRGQVEQREVERRREKEKLEREKSLAQTTIKANQDKVQKLSRELDVARQDHSSEVKRLTEQWKEQLRQAKLDNERIKEASVRRCSELAKEVWQLKAQLDSTH